MAGAIAIVIILNSFLGISVIQFVNSSVTIGNNPKSSMQSQILNTSLGHENLTSLQTKLGSFITHFKMFEHEISSNLTKIDKTFSLLTTLSTEIKSFSIDASQKLRAITESLEQNDRYFVVSLIIGLFAIFLIFFVEWIKKPRLTIVRAENSDSSDVRFLHCRVINRPIRILQIFVDRNSSPHTSVNIQFLDLQGNNLPFRRNMVRAKWTSKPEPLTSDRMRFDSTKLSEDAYRETIVSDDVGEPFPVLVKNIGENACYAVTGDTYQTIETDGYLRNPDFIIHSQHFLIRLRATSGASSSRTVSFAVCNIGTRLEDLSWR